MEGSDKIQSVNTQAAVNAAMAGQGRALKTAFSVIFCLMLLLPGVGTIWGWDLINQLQENRVLTKAPEISIETFASSKNMADAAKAIELYLTDCFGFRRFLVLSSKLMRYFILATSPSKAVFLGRNGWHYYALEGNIEEYRNLNPFDKVNINRWSRFFRHMDELAQKHHFSFFVIPAPNSPTIYPENLPRLLSKMQTASGKVRTESRLDRLVRRINNRQFKASYLVDVRDVLLKKKLEHPVYKRTDSHWNNLGAFYASQRLVEVIREKTGEPHRLNELSLENFKVQQVKTKGGDLAAIMGIGEFLNDEDFTLLSTTAPFEQEVVPPTKDREAHIYTELADKSKLKATVFRDSFANTMYPFISSVFSQVHYISIRQIFEDVIEEDKPDIVILEFAERYLYSPVPAITRRNSRSPHLKSVSAK